LIHVKSAGRKPDAHRPGTRLNGSMSQDALLGLLFPVWQLAIGACVLVTVVLCARRLLRRGPSRMNRALIVIGGAALGLATLSLLLASR
jgi:hypothetical protein